MVFRQSCTVLAKQKFWFEWVFVRPSSNKSRNRALSELKIKDLIYFMHFLKKNNRGKVECVFGAQRIQSCFVASVLKWVVVVVQGRWSLWDRGHGSISLWWVVEVEWNRQLCLQRDLCFQGMCVQLAPECIWLCLTLVRTMALSGNGRRSSSACRAAQVQTEASLRSWRGDPALGLVFFCLFSYFSWTNDVLHFVALAMGLCVAMIAFVRLPSLKVSCLLLSGLLIYDVFWVSVWFGFAETVFMLWICNRPWACFTWNLLVWRWGSWQSQKIGSTTPFWDAEFYNRIQNDFFANYLK